ncbi:MAG: FAD-dependent monooxygenase [Piscinibacter sp.]|nr:FAD-dependent monooxygenase [Piscinibacter sp.]
MSRVNSIAVIGAGPVGLALALRAAELLPQAVIALFDGRVADKDLRDDSRTLALALGSVQLLRRLDAWPAPAAQPILEVRVSQQQAVTAWPGRHPPELRILAREEGVPMLGAVLSYGALVTCLQQRWMDRVAREPARLQARFGQPVTGLKTVDGAVEVDAGVAERFDLAVVAEGGVFAEQARKAVTHDYRQAAWVGTLGWAEGAPAGVAVERFTRNGPLALLPLPDRRSALVWCVDADDDPLPALDDTQRLAVLHHLLPADLGAPTTLSPLKRFALGLNAERTLTQGRTVRIGNAAQTLHPVAGQGLNLGLRDAWSLVEALRRGPDVDAALRRLEWQRAPDRWSMIAATDFLARSFTWSVPGAGVARGLGLAALQAFAPARSALARQMMFGGR